MSIGSNIKKWREYRNYKQTELAEMLGVSDKTISSWEINRTEPKMGMVERICIALECKKSDIVGDDYFNDKIINLKGPNIIRNALANEPMPEDSYYLNKDAMDLAQFMFENPEYKVLFDASRKVKKEDIDFVRQMIDRMRGDDNDTGC